MTYVPLSERNASTFRQAAPSFTPSAALWTCFIMSLNQYPLKIDPDAADREENCIVDASNRRCWHLCVKKKKKTFSPQWSPLSAEGSDADVHRRVLPLSSSELHSCCCYVMSVCYETLHWKTRAPRSARKEHTHVQELWGLFSLPCLCASECKGCHCSGHTSVCLLMQTSVCGCILQIH